MIAGGKIIHLRQGMLPHLCFFIIALCGYRTCEAGKDFQEHHGFDVAVHHKSSLQLTSSYSLSHYFEANVVSCNHMKQHDPIELVAVFKKTIKLEQALQVLDEAAVEYRKGMDSSRGKIYFYSTGPKFILTFQTQQDKENFLAQHKGKKAFYEIYTPDWTKQKD